MKLKPSVVEFLGNERSGNNSNGDVLTGYLNDVARMERVYKIHIEDLRRRIYNPKLIEASINARIREIFSNPFSWARIGCWGISQRDIDVMRKFFPEFIPGHSTITKAKVKAMSPGHFTKSESNFISRRNWLPSWPTGSASRDTLQDMAMTLK